MRQRLGINQDSQCFRKIHSTRRNFGNVMHDNEWRQGTIGVLIYDVLKVINFDVR